MKMGSACRSATLVLVLLCVFGGGRAQNEEADFLMDSADSTSGDYLRKVTPTESGPLRAVHLSGRLSESTQSSPMV